MGSLKSPRGPWCLLLGPPRVTRSLGALLMCYRVAFSCASAHPCTMTLRSMAAIAFPVGAATAYPTAVVKVQSTIRGFFGRKRAWKEYLFCLAMEHAGAKEVGGGRGGGREKKNAEQERYPCRSVLCAVRGRTRLRTYGLDRDRSMCIIH